MSNPLWYAVHIYTAFMGILFTLFYQPIANLLFILMNLVGTNSIVLGILLLVIVVKMVLLPTSVKNSKIQRKMSEISGELENIKKNIKEKKEQAEKTLEVYKRVNINPLTPILFLAIQIPFFISIFFITRDLGIGLFKYEEVLYQFVSRPEFVDFFFLSQNTMEKGGIIIASLIVVSQVILMQQTKKKGIETPKNTKILTFVLPIIIGVFSLSITATVGIYWLFNNLISILQEVFIKNATANEEPEQEKELTVEELQQGGMEKQEEKQENK